MPRTYTCEKCAKTFNQKSHFTDHMQKKNDCSKSTQLTTVIEKKVEEKVKEVVRSLTAYPELVLPSDSDQRRVYLQAYFEQIHNLLWNRAGLNPEKALEHLTFFFAYRLIEAQADTLSLPQDCRWSFLASHKNENDSYETMKKGCTAFQKNKVTKLFFKKPEIEKADVIYEVIQQINRIPLKALQESDTLGDIFEYMLGRGMSTMSDEGQYFTNRAICRLAFKLSFDIKKTLRRSDGTLCTFADWFCGTGGFPAEYVKGVKNHLGQIDWKKECGKIYCQDMNLSSITTTLLNLLILTGIPFSGDTIRSANSFSDAITLGPNAPFKGTEIDYCFMNPPYGGDKTKGKEYKFAYAKKVKDDDGTTTKKFYVNQEIQSIGVEDDDKVSAGVQLAMATLAAQGICAIVLPQGFFFGASKKCVELRKKIAEDYTIHYVVDIASGSFLNTGTKTSMMVFQKGVGPTKKVSFIGLDEKPLVEATLEELRAKHYSLNYKQYLPQSAVEVEGFESRLLKDVCTFKRGTMITKAHLVEGKFPVIGGGLSPMGYHTENNRPANTILISQSGENAGHVSKYTTPVWASDCFSVESSNTAVLDNAYLYHILKSIEPTIKSLKNGTAQPHVYPSTIESLGIAIPSLERQQQIVEAIDGWKNLAQNEEVSLNMLEKQMMFQVKEMGKGHTRVKLGDVCEFQRGKMITKKDLVEGEFPVIGGGLSPMGYHTSSNRKAYTPLVSQSGENAGHISRYTMPVWASDCFSISSAKMSDDFLYYSLLQIKDEINFLKTGTAQPHIYPSSIENLQIPLPPLSEQQSLQSDFYEIRHKHLKIAEYKAKTQEAIQRLIPGAV
jgi:type I restriction enzyme, S subunit